ncbi:selenocysteine lyase [Desulfocapsa sulfexigens DSM 10523]|uniref:Selenocysteine lyase n=1 Tax=Desulfocapsa sulfexigens (strain DSM 10523 / SB164P1) TaxID=1167006 RepID=M1P1K7_DESSD|nr:aminotransferase class V-fold PLP-dependent enzyme [Desulfocapsa sulfexigens]AGF77388.1 selenocysteine lyase [Desulfocapsa sulfexigens DSM 10523]
MFDKSEKAFPVKKNSVFLAHCAISPMQRQAEEAAQDYLKAMAEGGVSRLPPFFSLLPRFHQKCGQLFKTDSGNISSTHNTAEGMCLIANGYPFQPGDEIISYIHEFPSNHYPWRLQERRGVKLVLLDDHDPLGTLPGVASPRGWSMEELEAKVSSRTRIIALSHVQFSSGYAADLVKLGRFCRERNIDLVIDGAQSVGCLPLYPEECNVAAVAVSSWKWLMGPFGAGLLYTSPEFRDKIEVTMVGASSMQQGLEYLDHTWNPHVDGRKFEYSTLSWEHLAAINGLLDAVFLRYPMEDIRMEVLRLQNVFLQYLDPDLFTPLLFPEAHRSGILAILPETNAQKLVERVGKLGIVATVRSEYIRIAPHFYLVDDDMKRAAECFNREAGQ